MHVLYRYLYEDIWVPTWPNWFAAVPVGLYARVKLIKWHHANVARDERHHKEVMASHDKILSKLRRDNGKVK